MATLKRAANAQRAAGGSAEAESPNAQEEARRQAREFFGLDLVEHDIDIQIILQSDSFVDVLTSEPYGVSAVVVSDPKSGRKKQISLKKLVATRPHGRLLKAREWVNRYDAAGARQLVLMLRKYDEKHTAVISPLRHGEAEESASRPERARGLRIMMGLGYTDASVQLLNKACEGWARIASKSPVGDCLEVNRRVLDHSMQPAFSKLHRIAADATDPRDDKGWDRLLPHAWDLDIWTHNSDRASRRSRSDHAAPRSRDYGLILRHTTRNGDAHRVEFICAGFTEFGTYRAGQFLARNWERLRQQAGPVDSGGCARGDFLAIIAGESFAEVGAEWDLAYFVSERGLAQVAEKCNNGPLFNARWVRRWHGISEDIHPLQPKVFVSYAHQDGQLVDALVRRLQSDGANVWLDRIAIDPGSKFDAEILEAISKQDVLVVVITRHSIASPYVRKELEIASRHDHLALVPVLIGELKPSDLPKIIRDRHCVKFALAGIEEVPYAEMLQAIRLRSRRNQGQR